MTVAEKIKQITRDHLLNNNGLAMGQCLTAVGWVGGTVPELSQEQGLIELSMADVSGGGIAVGAALAGRRPIYIVRYQGFQWYNSPVVVNYAAKSKEMWGVPCPVFVRSIAMEGGIGPVAGSSHHGMYMRMPGIPIAAPMTPGEYQQVWDYFMDHDDPIYVSEHRRSFPIEHEMQDVIRPDAEITLLAISATRLNAIEALKKLDEEGIKCNLAHILWIKPFQVEGRIRQALAGSKYGGLLLDCDFQNGVAKNLAFDIMRHVPQRVDILTLEERTAGFPSHLDNLPPSADKIVEKVKEMRRVL